MGVSSELVVADSAEAESVTDSDEPSGSWEGFAFAGLDRIKLTTLAAILEQGEAYESLDSRLDAISVVRNSDDGPWVDVLPPEMVLTLSRIASMEGDSIQDLLEKWSATDELEGWGKNDVCDLLREIGDLAESAVLQRKTLLLWTCL
ncbi:hypothetical protein AYO47_01010 [Planctomyces sp. SCGC AG-212-M04]|nr:hypothetical protein AYO47_01010 [Planctomyces sp. SCGC AG-212-M04]